MKKQLLFLLLCLSAYFLSGQSPQLCDSSFSYSPENPSSDPPLGSMVCIDEAHNNFHTRTGRFCGFSKVLEADGYQVSSNLLPFDQANLNRYETLVIANALDAETALRGWRLPNRSAFSSAEIAALQTWVSRGGSLLLIADHMPFPGCAAELAAAFGFSFTNGYESNKDPRIWPTVFSKAENSLLPHPITEGISQLCSFTGQAFRLPPGAEPLLRFGNSHQLILTTEAGQPDPSTNPHFDISGWSQGAVMAFGQGRIAVFGEAAMFTAQTLATGNGQALKVGLHHPQASQNAPFLLNLLRWLQGEIGWQVDAETATAICAQTYGMEEGMRSGDMQRVADYYLDDAIVTSPGGLLASGRAQLDAYWGGFAGIDWRLDVMALAPSMEALKESAAFQQTDAPFPAWQAYLPERKLGELVYQLGRSHLSYTQQGQKRLSIVDFLLIWEKQTDGTFKILVDTYR